MPERVLERRVQLGRHHRVREREHRARSPAPLDLLAVFVGSHVAREHGVAGFEEYLETKVIALPSEAKP